MVVCIDSVIVKGEERTLTFFMFTCMIVDSYGPVEKVFAMIIDISYSNFVILIN